MKKQIVSLVTVLLLFSCGTKEENTHAVANDTLAPKRDTVLAAPTTTIPESNEKNRLKLALLVKTCVHPFSDASQADTFRLIFTGTDLLHADVAFEITNAKGKNIYTDHFTSDDILMTSYSPEELPDPEKFIRDYADQFFDEKGFLSPAMKEEETGGDEDGNFADPKDAADIFSDRTAIGFFYLIQKENGRSIAYSKKRKKVVVYSSCC